VDSKRKVKGFYKSGGRYTHAGKVCGAFFLQQPGCFSHTPIGVFLGFRFDGRWWMLRGRARASSIRGRKITCTRVEFAVYSAVLEVSFWNFFSRDGLRTLRFKGKNLHNHGEGVRMCTAFPLASTFARV
jgi:hypothetical protein